MSQCCVEAKKFNKNEDPISYPNPGMEEIYSRRAKLGVTNVPPGQK
jgi:hypothetical protein